MLVLSYILFLYCVTCLDWSTDQGEPLSSLPISTTPCSSITIIFKQRIQKQRLGGPMQKRFWEEGNQINIYKLLGPEEAFPLLAKNLRQKTKNKPPSFRLKTHSSKHFIIKMFGLMLLIRIPRWDLERDSTYTTLCTPAGTGDLQVLV